MSHPNDKPSSSSPPPPSSSNNPNTEDNNPTTNPNTNTPTTNDSLPSRIQSSASTLARNAFLAPSAPADVSSSLASGGASKASPAGRAGAGAGAGRGYFTEASGTSTSGSGSGSGTGSGSAGRGTAGASFRSSLDQSDRGVAGAEEAFQRTFHDGDTGGLGFTPAGSGDTFTGDVNQGKDKGKGKQADIPSSSLSSSSSSSSSFDQIWESQHQQHQHQQHQHQQQPDGTDVLNILTSPTFNPDNPDNDYTSDLPATDLSDYPDPSTTTTTAPAALAALTPTEIQILETFRRADPNPAPNAPLQDKKGLSSTSLVPDIASFLDSVPAGQTTTTTTTNDATALRDAVLTGLPGAEDWVAVEERYHDEVWGYLKPVLEEVAKEMESGRQGESQGGDGDGPAVVRLKMILRHMQA